MSNDDNRIRGRYFNFQLRRNFLSGVYCVLVRSYHTGTEDYTMYAVDGTEPGSSNATAKALQNGGADPWRDRPGKRRRLLPAGFTQATLASNVTVYAISWNLAPVDATALEPSGETEIPGNEFPLRARPFYFRGRIGFQIRGEEIGVRGVAPGATIHGDILPAAVGTYGDEADAMTCNRIITTVSNNRWDPPDGPWLGRASSSWRKAVNPGIG